jgi:hypothetical protein
MERRAMTRHMTSKVCFAARLELLKAEKVTPEAKAGAS